MNSGSGSHEITPEFRARLEWQIESALRRETRFAAPVDRRMPRLRLVAALVAAIALGGIAVAGSGELQEARQRDLLLDSARSDEAVVRLRLELARTDYEDTRRRFEVGTANREALEGAERQVRAMEAALARVQLDIAEIEATAAAPRDDLQAPVIDQRDFVRERLLIEVGTAKAELEAAEQAALKTRERFDTGLVSQAAVLQAESEREQANARLKLLLAKIKIRERAVANEIKPEEVAATARRMELTLQAERLQREIEMARRRLQEVRRLVDVGRATQLDVKRLEVELLELELELQRVRRELQMVDSVRR